MKDVKILNSYNVNMLFLILSTIVDFCWEIKGPVVSEESQTTMNISFLFEISTSTSSTIHEDILKYRFKSYTLQPHGNIIQFWYNNKLLYPKLYQVALNILIIPPTQATSETFSTIGDIYTPKEIN